MSVQVKVSIFILCFTTLCSTNFSQQSCLTVAPCRRYGLLRAGTGPYIYVPPFARNGPRRWGFINCPGYKTCRTGKKQSPINISLRRGRRASKRITIHSRVSLVNYNFTANNFEFKCRRNCGTLSLTSTAFNFDQVHLHIPSEHTLNGRRFPMEIHFVHVGRNGKIAVLGVLFRIGRRNEQLQKLIFTAIFRKKSKINFRRLLKDLKRNSRFALYDGSLTAPPCVEGIQWVVSTKILTLSRNQFYLFSRLLGGKPVARPLQKLNRRVVTLV